MSKKIRVKKLQGSPYAIEQDIAGKGATATIVKAYNTENLQEDLACKIISLREEQNNNICKTQLLVLKELPHHPNLVNYKKIQISSEKNLYLIMEYCNGGNLEKYLFDNKYNIPEEKIWLFLKQFCSGYKVLYDNSLVHRDIKTQNILIHNGSFKIADFGLSKVTSHPEQVQNLSIKGTPIYMAPEIPELKQGNSKVDVFSLGVVVYRLAFKGQYPFFDQGRKYRSINEYFRELKVRKMVIPENNQRSPDLLDLIKRMLDKDHTSRISWKQLFEHPRIVKALNCDRKKEMTNMETFKKSLIFVNKSVIKLSEVENPNSQQAAETQTCLILEQAFNKNKKSMFQRRLYRYKLLYTVIEYVNTKIKNYLHKKEKVHKHINKTMKKIVVQGLEFGLFVINALRDISGEWDEFNTYEINNFENIFENDREILEDDLNSFLEQEDNKNFSSHLRINQSQQLTAEKKSKIIKLSYEDVLYRYLTEYYEYPRQLREELRSTSVLLVDIYDMVLKFESSYNGCEEDQEPNGVEAIEDQQKNAFYNYLMNSEKTSEKQLFASMQKKGLIFR